MNGESNYNTFIGRSSMHYAQYSKSTIGVGTNADYGTSNILSSENNIFIGNNIKTTPEKQSTVLSNTIAIGNGIVCKDNDTTTIGNTATKSVVIYGDMVIVGSDGVRRQIVFNPDGSCSWTVVS